MAESFRHGPAGNGQRTVTRGAARERTALFVAVIDTRASSVTQDWKMTELIVRLPAVASASGVFSACVMARDLGNGSWEGWLEFAPAHAGAASSLITGIETRQHDRLALERWASGLTRVYAEGALARSAAGPSRPGI